MASSTKEVPDGLVMPAMGTGGIWHRGEKNYNQTVNTYLPQNRSDGMLIRKECQD